MEKAKSRITSTSTPLRTNLRDVFSENKLPSDIGSPPSSSNIKKSTTVLDMVIEAINAIGVPKKGASYMAIKKWITDNKEVDPQRLKTSLKVAVKKGVDKGILLRPRKSETAVGATGSFMLAVIKPLKSLRKTVNKSEKPTKKNIKKLPTVSKNTSPTKADGITSKTAKLPNTDKKIVARATKNSPKKAYAQKNPVTMVPSKKEAEKKPSTKESSKAKVEKKPATKALLKMDAEKKLPTKVIPKEKAPSEKILKPIENNFATNDSQFNEDPANGEVISEAPKRGKVNTKTQGKTKAMKPTDNNAVALKLQSDENLITEVVTPVAFTRRKVFAKNKAVENVQSNLVHTPAIKDRKNFKTKKLPKPNGTSNNHTKVGSKIAKTENNKKLYASENEMDRYDFSDSEVAIKKNRVKVVKSFSSDTELEVSKRVEKKTKVLRAKKNAAKAH